MGSGLYRLNTCIGYEIFNWQTEIFEKVSEEKCEIQAKLIELDKEYMTLYTKTYTLAGGKDKGKKAEKNLKRAQEILKEQKKLKTLYNAPFGFIEPLILKID